MCNKDFNRAEFSKHECIKDYYTKMLRNSEADILEYLAENLMMLRRNKGALGICINTECVNQYKASKEFKKG